MKKTTKSIEGQPTNIEGPGEGQTIQPRPAGESQTDAYFTLEEQKMKVVYLPGTEQWPEGKALIEQATNRIEEILGPSAELATVTWQRTEDSRGRTVYRLKLKDLSGEVSADFSPVQLASAPHMHVRLHRLWGDLLQIRNNEVHAKAVYMSGQLAGTECE